MFKLKFIAVLLGLTSLSAMAADPYSNDIYMYRDKHGQMVLTDVKTEGAKLVSKGLAEKPTLVAEPVVMEITTANGKKIIQNDVQPQEAPVNKQK